MNFSFIGFLLLISQFHVAQSSERHQPKVIIGFRDGHVNLPCQYTPSKESKFNLTLLRGNERHAVCVVYSDDIDTKFFHWKDQVPCHLRKSGDNTFGFTLYNLETQHTDNYLCHIQIYFPPPYKSASVNETYVYIHDSLPQNCNIYQPYIIWILIGLVTLLFLGIIGSLYLWIHQRRCHKCETTHTDQNNEHNSEYMPMASVNATRSTIL